MKISEIDIKGLYGSYSYKITQLEHQNLLLLTGYNGMGKTTILNIVKGIADSNLWFFYELPFDEINVCFEDGLSLKIRHLQHKSDELIAISDNSDANINPERPLVYEWFKDGASLSRIIVDRHTFYKAFVVLYKAEFISEDDTDWIPLMKSRMNDVVSYISRKQNAKSMDMLQSSVKAFMIPAQRVRQIRLKNPDEGRFPYDQSELEEIDTIEVVAEKFGKLLDRKRIEFLTQMQSSKNGLMERLLDADAKDIGKDAYEAKAKDVQDKIDDLSQFGIAYEHIRPYNAANGKLLSAYLGGLKEMLEKFSGLIQDLKLFSSILQKKHFLHKTISFSPSYGFKAFDDKGISIPSSKLSSGEQNIIILLYRIIFEVHDGDILLIDEPEISMHVVWLKEFIDDLQTIAATKSKVQIVIATHSPQIVRGAVGYCFDLEMNNDGK